MTTKTRSNTTEATRTAKVSKKLVESAQELARVRADIRQLEARKSELTKELEEAFGKNSEAKTSEFDTLLHNNLVVAKLRWTPRQDIDRKKLALEFPEAFEACQYDNTYAVVKL